VVDRSFGLVHDDSTTDIVTVIALPAYYAEQGLCNGMVPVLSSLLCPSVPSMDRCMPVMLLCMGPAGSRYRSRDPDHAHSGDSQSSQGYYFTWPTHEQNLNSLALAVPEILHLLLAGPTAANPPQRHAAID